MTRKSIPALLLILPVAALILLLATFLQPPVTTRLKAFRIVSGSMEPALLVGDRVMVELLSPYRPGRGEVVVFASVLEPNLTIVSRVVATAGDTVGMSDGELYVNGHQPPRVAGGSAIRSTDAPEQLERMAQWQRPFLLSPTDPYSPDRHNWGPLVVPAASFLVLGDNRELSYDSRFWGFVPVSHIQGRPRYVYYSYDPQSYRPLPWLSAIRWGRIGHRVS